MLIDVHISDLNNTDSGEAVEVTSFDTRLILPVTTPVDNPSTDDSMSDVSVGILDTAMDMEDEQVEQVDNKTCKTCLRKFKTAAFVLDHHYQQHVAGLWGEKLKCAFPRCNALFPIPSKMTAHFNKEHKPFRLTSHRKCEGTVLGRFCAVKETQKTVEGRGGKMRTLPPVQEHISLTDI